MLASWDFWIAGPLPGQNEIIKAAKGSGGRGRAYSRLKAKLTNDIALTAKAARIPHVKRARFLFHWIETSKRRNPDNIAAAHKFVFDGLVLAGVLSNDGWAQVAGWSDTFEVGKRPGVFVTVLES